MISAEDEWLFVPDGVLPPALYFNLQKLTIWCNSVDYLQVNELINVHVSFKLWSQVSIGATIYHSPFSLQVLIFLKSPYIAFFYLLDMKSRPFSHIKFLVMFF